MREIDTETSVVWPAWCYSGETVNEDLPQTAISPSLQQQSSNQSQQLLNNKNRGKRKTPTTIIQPIRPLSSGAVNNNNNDSNITNNNNNNTNSHQTTLQSLDKMLSERIYERKKYLNSPNNMSSFYDKLRNGDSDNPAANLISSLVNNSSNSASLNNKNISDLSVINNNNTSVNNNSQNNNNTNNNNNNNNNTNHSGSSNNSSATSIKSERFSPNSHDVQSTASRSRSVTPSSFSGTPPQTLNSNEMFPGGVPAALLLPSPNANPNRTEFQARNCSDIMRSLAAKYNNNNDQTSIKNSFLEPKMRVNQPKPFLDSPLSKRPSPIAPAQVPNSNSIMSSLFPGLPFQSAVFPPLIDMTSTQALVALARAAKESELANMLKNDSNNKKTNSRNSSPPIQNSFQSPFPPNYLPGLLPAFQLQTSPSLSSSSSALKSPSRPTENSTTPLDLSSSTPPISKRMKLSPNPGKTITPSPSPSLITANQQPQQQNESVDQKPTRKCHALSDELNSWTVDNVCDFVGNIDICAEYVQNFRDQSIDGTGLPLLTEEHLTNSLGMKLGPALKLKSLLAKKLGGPCPCTSCTTQPIIKGEAAIGLGGRPPSIEPGS